VSSSVDDELGRVGDLVDAALPRFLGTLTPGPFAEVVATYPRRRGKALRPALCLAACRALGGRERDALEAAVALELLHAAFLVHDDVEDASPTRRGRPSLPAAHGSALAVHAGDALVALAVGPLLAARAHLDAGTLGRVVEELELMARVTVDGQARDLVGPRRRSLDEADVADVADEADRDAAYDDVLRTMLMKTACYSVVAPCRIGALVATAGRVDVDRFDRYGAWLGLAYQLRDDHLDAGEPRRTLAVTHLLTRARPAERAFVDGLLARTAANAAEQARLRRLLERRGSLAFADEVAVALAIAAEDEVAVAFGPGAAGPDGALLRDLPKWAVTRTV
jgi:geranylgeranyl diphosphate synthase type II